MDEILKDKIFWTQEKFRQKPQESTDSESTKEQLHSSKSYEKSTSDVQKPKEVENSDSKEEKSPEEVDAFKSIENKVIGLYFAADWCIPCQEFTYLLKETYEEIRERSSPLEIVFVSFDRRMEEMKSFFMGKHGDWLAVPFKDPLVDTLKSKYSITAIPKLIIIRDNGTIITEKGRKDVQDKGIICFRGWLQKANLSATKPSEQTQNDDNAVKEKDKEKTVTFKENIISDI